MNDRGIPIGSILRWRYHTEGTVYCYLGRATGALEQRCRRESYKGFDVFLGVEGLLVGCDIDERSYGLRAGVYLWELVLSMDDAVG